MIEQSFSEKPESIAYFDAYIYVLTSKDNLYKMSCNGMNNVQKISDKLIGREDTEFLIDSMGIHYSDIYGIGCIGQKHSWKHRYNHYTENAQRYGDPYDRIHIAIDEMYMFVIQEHTSKVQVLKKNQGTIVKIWINYDHSLYYAKFIVSFKHRLYISDYESIQIFTPWGKFIEEINLENSNLSSIVVVNENRIFATSGKVHRHYGGDKIVELYIV